jgi:transposase
VKIAALDPAAPYRSALTDPEVGLHNAQLVLDHFHVSKLANVAIDDVRRRVQQETTLLCQPEVRHRGAFTTRHEAQVEIARYIRGPNTLRCR